MKHTQDTNGTMVQEQLRILQWVYYYRVQKTLHPFFSEKKNICSLGFILEDRETAVP